MPAYSRRQFVGSAMATIATSGAILGASDRVNVAIIGMGGRGNDHLVQYGKQPNCRIAAVCDVDSEACRRAVARVERAYGYKPKACSDMRQLLGDKDIDVISLVTPNHWHALQTIWACQAGKDVYVEKPACHNVFEGRKMIEAARESGRIVMAGSQSRSLAYKIRAMKLLSEGIIGRVYLAKGLCFKRRSSIGRKPNGAVPPGLDWDMFLGPAPLRPFNPNRFKYNWHWFWDTGNGDIGNQGAHELDIARWGLGKSGPPKSVVASGGKYAYDDDQETPNTLLATFDYGDSELVFEVRGLPTGSEGGLARVGGNVVGNLFYGSEGYMEVGGGGFQVYKGDQREKVMDEPAADGPSPSEPHFTNFLAAVRTRDRKHITADVETGVVSASLAHLANASYRTGRKLVVDAPSWRFAGDDAASRLLTREYRAPYVVSDKV